MTELFYISEYFSSDEMNCKNTELMIKEFPVTSEIYFASYEDEDDVFEDEDDLEEDDDFEDDFDDEPTDEDFYEEDFEFDEDDEEDDLFEDGEPYN